MKLTKRSPFSQKINTMDIPITEAELAAYYNGDELIQNVFPQLTPDQREFIMTGITPQEWEETFKNSK